MANYHPSQKSSKNPTPDLQDIAEGANKNLSPQHGSGFIGRPPRTYINQLPNDAGCFPEDLPNAMERPSQRYPC